MKTTLKYKNLWQAVEDGYEPKIGDIFTDMNRRKCELIEIIPAPECESSVDKNGIKTTIHYSDRIRWKVIETGRSYTGTMNNLYREFTYNVEVL